MTGGYEMNLKYVIKHVDDMDRAIGFFRDTLSLKLRFQSPFWTEFETGETTLALHPATPEHPAGTVRLGFATPDLAGFYERRDALGLTFVAPPTPLHGSIIAQFLDCEGANCVISDAG
jgi:predicted enzyme related to lactoylglutathione lyase